MKRKYLLPKASNLKTGQEKEMRRPKKKKWYGHHERLQELYVSLHARQTRGCTAN